MNFFGLIIFGAPHCIRFPPAEFMSNLYGNVRSPHPIGYRCPLPQCCFSPIPTKCPTSLPSAHDQPPTPISNPFPPPPSTTDVIYFKTQLQNKFAKNTHTLASAKQSAGAIAIAIAIALAKAMQTVAQKKKQQE